MAPRRIELPSALAELSSGELVGRLRAGVAARPGPPHWRDTATASVWVPEDVLRDVQRCADEWGVSWREAARWLIEVGSPTRLTEADVRLVAREMAAADEAGRQLEGAAPCAWPAETIVRYCAEQDLPVPDGEADLRRVRAAYDALREG